jgi:hypothetical protein
VAAIIPNIDLRLSDKRLFQIIDHFESIPFPQSNQLPASLPSIESDVGERVSVGKIIVDRVASMF